MASRRSAATERGAAASDGGCRLARQQREQARELVGQVAAVDDQVDSPLLDEEFGALEPFGQLLAHRLLDYARTREADQRARLGQHQIGDEGERRGNAAHRRVRENRHERQSRFRQLLQHGGGLGHLEQRIDAFLHPGPAGCRHADERQPVLVCDAHATDESLADDRAHRPAHEIELERRKHEWDIADASLHDDERIGLARLLERDLQPPRIPSRVLELEAVDRDDLEPDLEAALGIEQLLDALARRHAVVEVALRTDEQVLLEVGAIERRFARRALDPQPLRHRRLAYAGRAFYARRKEFLQPAHTTPTLAAYAAALSPEGEPFASWDGPATLIRPPRLRRTPLRCPRRGNPSRLGTARRRSYDPHACGLACVERLANRREERACATSRLRRQAVPDFADDAAADDDCLRMRGDRARARGIANAEAHADRQRHVPAYFRKPACDVAGIEVAGPGDACQAS